MHAAPGRAASAEVLSKARVLFWQAIVIAAWSILFGVVVGGVIHNAG